MSLTTDNRAQPSFHAAVEAAVAEVNSPPGSVVPLSALAKKLRLQDARRALPRLMEG